MGYSYSLACQKCKESYGCVSRNMSGWWRDGKDISYFLYKHISECGEKNIKVMEDMEISYEDFKPRDYLEEEELKLWRKECEEEDKKEDVRVLEDRKARENRVRSILETIINYDSKECLSSEQMIRRKNLFKLAIRLSEGDEDLRKLCSYKLIEVAFIDVSVVLESHENIPLMYEILLCLYHNSDDWDEEWEDDQLDRFDVISRIGQRISAEEEVIISCIKLLTICKLISDDADDNYIYILDRGKEIIHSDLDLVEKKKLNASIKRTMDIIKGWREEEEKRTAALNYARANISEATKDIEFLQEKLRKLENE